MASRIAPLRVLIVDHESLLRWAIAQVLVDAGFVILEAGTASDAIEVVSKEAAVDVIVVDCRLPDCSDLSLLLALRRLVSTALIIVMSDYTDTSEFVTRMIDMGAQHVLSKPFELTVLPSLIRHAHQSRSGSGRTAPPESPQSHHAGGSG